MRAGVITTEEFCQLFLDDEAALNGGDEDEMEMSLSQALRVATVVRIAASRTE